MRSNFHTHTQRCKHAYGDDPAEHDARSGHFKICYILPAVLLPAFLKNLFPVHVEPSSCQVCLAWFQYSVAKCTCQDILQSFLCMRLECIRVPLLVC